MKNDMERKGILIGKEVLDEMEVIESTKRKEEVNCGMAIKSKRLSG